MIKEINEGKDKMSKSIDAMKNDFASIRAGRANPGVLDRVMVDYYGVPTPIQQVGSVTVSEATTLLIQPWDKTLLKPIEKAIMTSDLGINPANDGNIIRIVFPSLTEERRKEICKTIHKTGEETKVAVRNIRRDVNDKLKALKKSNEITEDELKDYEDEVQKITDINIKNIDELVKLKEKEILSI